MKILKVLITSLLFIVPSCAYFDGLAVEIEKNPIVAGAIIQEVIIAAIKKSPSQDRDTLAINIQIEAEKAIDFFNREFVTANLIDEYIKKEYDFSKMRPSEIVIVQFVSEKVKQGLVDAVNDPSSGLNKDSLFTTKFVLENVAIGANWYTRGN